MRQVIAPEKHFFFKKSRHWKYREYRLGGILTKIAAEICGFFTHSLRIEL